MSKGSMKIIRRLPDAPVPTKPVKVKEKAPRLSSAIDLDPVVVDDPPEPKKEKPSHAVPQKKQAKNAEIGCSAAAEKARQRAVPVIELYKQGELTADIAEATGIPERSVKGIIARYIKAGKVKKTPNKEDRYIAELYNAGLNYSEMAEKLGTTGGAVASKLRKIRRMGLIGKRAQ